MAGNGWRETLNRQYRQHLSRLVDTCGRDCLALYMVLELYADDRGNCRPALRTLERRLGTGRHQVLHWLGCLEEAGYVVVQSTSSRRATNVYRLADWRSIIGAALAPQPEAIGAALAPQTESCGAALAPQTESCGAALAPERIRRPVDRESETDSLSAAYHALAPDDPLRKCTATQAKVFLRLWRDHPRKVGVAPAKVRWVQALKKTDGDPLPIITGYLAALPEWRKEAEAPERRKYIPHFATWLHQERWKDEL
jgi:hypothetical protein